MWREQIKCQFDWVPAYLFNPSAATGRPDQERSAVDLQKEAALAARARIRRRVRRRRAARQPAGRALRQPGEVPSAEISDRAAAPALRRQRLPGVRAHRRSRRSKARPSPRRPPTARGFTASTCSSRRTCRCRASRDSFPPRFSNRSSRPTAPTSSAAGCRAARFHEALYWDTGDPYDYVRVDRRHDHDFVIFGGEDHKTGQVEDTHECFTRLEQRLKQLLPEIAITHRWSGQVIETNDGLPYIGETAERQYAATGFAGNGMTFGTLSAMMFADYVAGAAESVGRAVRSGPHEDQRRALELPQGKQGLSVLPHPRPVRRAKADVRCDRSREATARSSTSTDRPRRSIAASTAKSTCDQRSARTWAATCTSTTPSTHGTARVTDRDSK